jgi:hypothetical protein
MKMSCGRVLFDTSRLYDDKITVWKLHDLLEDEKSKSILTVNSVQGCQCVDDTPRSGLIEGFHRETKYAFLTSCLGD